MKSLTFYPRRRLALMAAGILVLAATALGLFVTRADEPPPVPEAPKVFAVIAAQNVSRGSLVPDEAMMLVPVAELAPGMLTTIPSGRWAVSDVERGAFVMASDLADEESSKLISWVRSSLEGR